MKDKTTMVSAIEIGVCIIAQDLIRQKHSQKDIDKFINQFKFDKKELKTTNTWKMNGKEARIPYSNCQNPSWITSCNFNDLFFIGENVGRTSCPSFP